MQERLLYSVLKAGITHLRERPSLIVSFMQALKGQSAEDAAKVADYFRRLPPVVSHGFPRKDSKFPGIFITLGRDDEDQQFFNNAEQIISAELAEELGDPSFEGMLSRASLMKRTYNLFVVSDNNPDVAIYYYTLLRLIINMGRVDLMAGGFLTDEMHGADMMPSSMYLPSTLFVRRLSLTATVHEISISDEEFEFARRLGPIIVNEGQDPNFTGGVIPYTPPEVTVETEDE